MLKSFIFPVIVCVIFLQVIKLNASAIKIDGSSNIPCGIIPAKNINNDISSTIYTAAKIDTLNAFYTSDKIPT